jgi:sec-independent protein translocase protein TatB
MFGIGPGEMIILLVILLIAVGPKSMPTFMKAVGKGLREFRRTANDLRQQVGLDDLMREDDWRDPLGLKQPARAPAPARDRTLTPADQQREYPPEGADVRHALEGSPADDTAAGGTPPPPPPPVAGRGPGSAGQPPGDGP